MVVELCKSIQPYEDVRSSFVRFDAYMNIETFSPSFILSILLTRYFYNIIILIITTIIAYYYPTAKKRYLPRILKASDALNTLPNELSVAAKSISTTSQEEYNWDRVFELVAMVDDAVLPLQLYQSSLNGQGLSLSNEYAVRMKDAALRYERSAKQLTTLFQIGKKNTNPTKTLVTNLSTQETKIQSIVIDLTEAMNEYRKQGRLTDADNMSIPSATPEEMRRMAMRSKPSTSSSTSTTTTTVVP